MTPPSEYAYWQYRIVRFKGGGLNGDWYEIHECHFNADGECVAITAAAATVGGDSPSEVRETRLTMHHADLAPILDSDTRRVVAVASAPPKRRKPR